MAELFSGRDNGITGNYQSAPQSPYEAGISAKTQTPLDRVGRALSEARELTERVRSVVNALIGSQPEKPEGGECVAINGGILTSMADNAEDTLSELRKANDELSRLSKVLGLGL